jgi:hypothetical protein
MYMQCKPMYHFKGMRIIIANQLYLQWLWGEVGRGGVGDIV